MGPLTRADSREEAAKQFKTGKKADPNIDRLRDEARQIEATKTTRLRGLRLAQEASNKEAAERAVKVVLKKPSRKMPK
jgi:hypothetical protein